jgi:thiol peroxidase
MISDHRDASFGAAWGTLIRDLRILSRAIFVVGPDNKIKYVEYVPEVSDFPNYDAALQAASDAARHPAARS